MAGNTILQLRSPAERTPFTLRVRQYSYGVANPTFSSTTTLVIVPRLVRSASGELVTDLDASHFRLTDNGIEQKVSVAEAENQRLAMVVLMQTGGAASSQLWNYSKLDTLLENMLGSSTRKVALDMVRSLAESGTTIIAFKTTPRDF